MLFRFLFLAAFGILTSASPAAHAPTLSDSLQNVIAAIQPDAAIRVMVVGDSITHGREGDWTWRYRLWQWFKSQNVTVDFVGPFVGTLPSEKPEPPWPPVLQGASPPLPASAVTTGRYAVGVDADFDSHHFSAWGRQLAQDVPIINRMVATYNPDYLLVLLGFNDIGWFVSDAQGTLISMKTFISQARAAKPNVKFALGNIPQRTFIGGREDLPVKTIEYNKMLAAAIPSWNTSKSPIALVYMQENYDCGLDGCPAAYDGLHPNVLVGNITSRSHWSRLFDPDQDTKLDDSDFGEYQIAQAFTGTLVRDFQLGTSKLAIPDKLPVRPISVPTNVQAASSVYGITVTWDAVYGAIGYDIQTKLVGDERWNFGSLNTNRYDEIWAIDGQEWQYMVRMSNGEAEKSDWSEIVSAIARPRTPLAPTDIVTRATATGIDVSWTSGDAGIFEYAVLVYHPDLAGTLVDTIGFTSSPAHIDSLCPGDHYVVAVQAWNSIGGGLPGVGYAVTIGARTPPPPANVQITSIDGTSVQIAWCGSPEAAGYRVWHRNINNASDVLSTDDTFSTSDTNYGVFHLLLGVWNYEFCISAFNGNAESALSNCVVSPQPGNVAGGSVGGADCYIQAAGENSTSSCSRFGRGGSGGGGGGGTRVGTSYTSCSGASCTSCGRANCTTCHYNDSGGCAASDDRSICTGSDCSDCEGVDCQSGSSSSSTSIFPNVTPASADQVVLGLWPAASDPDL